MEYVQNIQRLKQKELKTILYIQYDKYYIIIGDLQIKKKK